MEVDSVQDREPIKAIPSNHTQGLDPETDCSRVGILDLSRELMGDLEQFIHVSRCIVA